MKIAMIGYGKMGKTIERLAKEQGHELVLKIKADNAHELTVDNLKQADVAIEFSRPDTAYENIMQCFKANIPVVCGTTAWLDQYEEVVNYCQKHQQAFFYASNFSVGVNIFFELNKFLAKMMNPQEDYQVELEEIHHTQKLDAPSGTAVTLAQDIIHQIDRIECYELTKNQVDNNCIPIDAKRIGNTPGTHAIQYESFIDSIEIKHIAKGREGFAQGAILAASWLIGKKGVYGMSDLLQLNR